VGKQRISAAIGFVLSTAIVVFVLVGCEGSRRGEVTASGEAPAPYKYLPYEQARERPVWLRDYSSHVPLIGILVAPVDSIERAESDLVERAESDALLDSFSPGVRASLEGARVTQAERHEAEYRAVSQERMRRLSEGQNFAD
jgi:hypothetical protein